MIAESNYFAQEHILALTERVAGVGSWRIDLTENKLMWSDQVYVIHGLSRDTFTPDLESGINFYHPEDRDQVAQCVQRAIESKQSFEFELRILRTDHEIRWVHSKGECELDEHGRVTAINGIFQDVTARHVMENELREKNILFENILEGTMAGHWDWIDVNEETEWWSPRFYELLGYEDGEIEPTLSTFTALLHPDDHERTFARVKAHFEEDKPFDIDYRLRTKSGTYRWFNGRAALQRDAQGNPLRMIGSITDIDEKIRFQSERDTFFNMSMDMLCVVSFDGQFKLVNPSFDRILGYAPEELYQTPLLDLVHPDDLPATVAELAKPGDKKTTLQFENRCRCKNGEYRWLSWHAVADREKESLYAVARDVSYYKKSEIALRNHARELERYNQELEQFAYIASHDLQEPLRKIQAFAERLSSNYSDRLEGKGIDYLNRMQNAAKRMQRLIQDLLLLSRITSHAKPFEPLDMGSLVRYIIQEFEIRIEELNAEIIIENLPPVTADRIQIQQLLRNLIGNALKFHRVDVPPCIRITADILEESESDGIYCLQIKDNGIGFDEKYLDRIFLPFQRLHGRMEYEGTGIGTAIVKKIVDRHGGTITAQSAPGKGATFIVNLPAGSKDK